MAIDATQSTDLVRSLTREHLQAGPKAKVELKKLEEDDKQQGLHQQDKAFSLTGDDGLSFWDVLDVFNPLQHIPVVNTIYRELTGDEIDPAMKLAGGGLFGGVIGLGAAAIDVAIEGLTGKDIGEHAVALATGDFDGAERDVLVAKADPDSAAAQTTASVTSEAASQSAAVAATNAAVIAAADPSKTNSLSKDSLSSLPDWDDDVAAASASAFAPGSVAALDAPTRAIKQSDKVFPMPERRFSGNRTSTAELRAQSEATAATQGTLGTASQLSPEAMRAAGLTQDMVDDILSHHGKSRTQPANSTERTEQQTAAVGQSNSTGGLESAWMFSAMNQALDKYQSASTLSTRSPNAVPPVLSQ